MQSRTFTQLDRRQARVFKAIRIGTVPPNSEAVSEFAELIGALEDQPVKPVVVARLTITRQNGWKTIIEVESGSTFSSFFKYYKQFGRKRSTKTWIRTANRNDGGIRSPRLENIAEKLATIQSMSNPVSKVTIRILDKRAYQALINARPDQLGLTHTSIPLPFARFNEARTS